MSTKIHRDNWNNVQELDRRGLLDETGYKAPKPKALRRIKKTDTVKISNGRERFWVLVTDIKGDDIYGTVDNFLTISPQYTRGDTVVFRRENVYDIHTKEWRDTEAIRMVQNQGALAKLAQLLFASGLDQRAIMEIMDSSMTVLN
jgi:hypothetical protein